MRPLIKLTKDQLKDRAKQDKEDRELRVIERDLAKANGTHKKTRKKKQMYDFPTFVCVHCKREMHAEMYNSYHKDNCAQNPDK